MKTSRFCLAATLFLLAFGARLQATRLPQTDQPFQAAFMTPDSGDLPLWGAAAWLGIGAALGWLLLSLSVGLLVRQERNEVTVRK